MFPIINPENTRKPSLEPIFFDLGDVVNAIEFRKWSYQ